MGQANPAYYAVTATPEPPQGQVAPETEEHSIEYQKDQKLVSQTH